MGISQVPPVPTPVAKGDIVVGTATGPTRLPVSTTANQTLLVDTTTATGLKYGSTTLVPTTYQITTPTAFTVTGVSYTNPNLTLTIGTHNLVVGQNIIVMGIITSGTPTIDSSYTITAVAATTITFNYGATTPGTYVSGGLVRLNVQGAPCVLKYINGVYFAATDQGFYFYSSDGITWQTGAHPGTNPITGIDHDGTTYAICTWDGRIFTSTTLLPNSWTQRAANSHTYHGIRWLGGSTNRWIVWGVGNAASTIPGTSGTALTATSGGVTWTTYTVSGVGAGQGWQTVGFDGNQTVALINSNAIAVSTNATGSFTSVARDSSYRPANTAGVASLTGATANQIIHWNPVASRWMSLMADTHNYSGTSTAGAPTSAWTRIISQAFPRSLPYLSNSSPYHLIDSRNFMQIDAANSRMLTHSFDAGVFTAYSYSLTPTVINTFEEFYPLLSIQSTIGMIGQQYFSASNSIASRPYVAGYLNNRWVLFYQITNSISNSNSFAVTIMQ